MNLTHVRLEPEHLEEMKERIAGPYKRERINEYFTLINDVVNINMDFYITSINVVAPLDGVKDGLVKNFILNWITRYNAYQGELMREYERQNNKEFCSIGTPEPLFYFVQNTDSKEGVFSMHGFFIMTKEFVSPLYRDPIQVLSGAVHSGLVEFLKLKPSVLDIHHFQASPDNIKDYINKSLEHIEKEKDNPENFSFTEQNNFNSYYTTKLKTEVEYMSKDYYEPPAGNFVNAKGVLTYWRDNMSKKDNIVGFFI